MSTTEEWVAELHDATTEHAAAQAHADRLLAARDAAIVRQLASKTHAQVAWATGLSYGSINRIATKARKQ